MFYLASLSVAHVGLTIVWKSERKETVTSDTKDGENEERNRRRQDDEEAKDEEREKLVSALLLPQLGMRGEGEWMASGSASARSGDEGRGNSSRGSERRRTRRESKDWTGESSGDNCSAHVPVR